MHINFYFYFSDFDWILQSWLCQAYAILYWWGINNQRRKPCNIWFSRRCDMYLSTHKIWRYEHGSLRIKNSSSFDLKNRNKCIIFFLKKWRQQTSTHDQHPIFYSVMYTYRVHVTQEYDALIQRYLRYSEVTVTREIRQHTYDCFSQQRECNISPIFFEV